MADCGDEGAPVVASRSTTEHSVHVDDPAASKVLRSRRWLHRATSAALFVILGLAVLDGFDVIAAYGVDTDVVSARDGDTELTVTYPSVTRPALASPFRIELRRVGGFDEAITIGVRRAYLEMWDVNGVLPAPSGESTDGAWVLWEFEPPEGDELSVTYEARIEPGVQSARSGAVALLDDGQRTLEVSFTTSVRP